MPIKPPEPRVTLRQAIPSDRRWIYESMIAEPLWATMMGGETTPEAAPPDYEEFCDDYRDYFFDGSRPELGRCFVIEADGEAVGQINHDRLEPRRGRMELDIWMRSEVSCGLGNGPRAIDLLCRLLEEELGAREFLLEPDERNGRAVRAYEKAGFRPVAVPRAEVDRLFGPPDTSRPLPMLRWAKPDPSGAPLIRPMLRGEEEAVCALVERCFNAHVAPDCTREGARIFFEYANAEAMAARCRDNCVVWVAQRDGLEGVIEVRDRTHVSQFFVETASQGKGMGRALFEEVLRWPVDGPAARAPMTVKSSLCAVPAYRRLGFAATSEPQLDHGIRYVPMERLWPGPGR